MTDQTDEQACEAGEHEPLCDHRCMLPADHLDGEDSQHHWYGYVLPSDADTIANQAARIEVLEAALQAVVDEAGRDRYYWSNEAEALVRLALGEGTA